jgi:methionyl-tRNA formyltransferase
MKIILITQGVSRIVNPLIHSGNELVAIIESAPRGYSPPDRMRQLIRRCSSAIKRIVFRNPTLLDVCKGRDIAYHLMHKGNNIETERFVKLLNPDLIVIYSMSQLLKKNIFTIPRLGTINLHPAYLPEYRGPNPDFWHYHDMNLVPGVTVHYIDEGEDTGDIILQDRIDVPLGMPSTERLNILIGEVGCKLLLDSVALIKNNAVTRKSQEKLSTTIRARHLCDAEHKSVINWSDWPIERIWNILRGTESWLNALDQPSGIYSGQRWQILDYEKISYKDLRSLGGISKDDQGYFIECWDGVIRIKKNFKFRVFFRFIYLRLRNIVGDNQ